VAVPVADHIKGEPLRPITNGYLVGIYMNTQGVHINRAPDHGILRKQIVYNGPHLNMTSAERKIILTQLVPGLVTLRKALKYPPHAIEQETDYISKSARETLVLENDHGTRIYVIRIADYYVGKILTWVQEGARVARGQRLGMITWGSQTDLLFEATPETVVTVKVGDYVYAGETIVARY
jgi:phosphatidylserine decarboxylase